jgi:hypothetical protein
MATPIRPVLATASDHSVQHLATPPSRSYAAAMKRLIASAMLLFVQACSPSIEGPAMLRQWERTLGTINQAFNPIVAPERVRVGEEFSITVSTVGSSSCSKADGEEVRVVGLFAEVVPYSREAPPGSACTDDLAQQPRTQKLRFEQAGVATIRVIARPSRPDMPIEAAVRIIVSPTDESR